MTIIKKRESIELVSVPSSLVKDVKAYVQGFERSLPVPLPLYSSKVAAGLPMPTEDDIEDTLDLHEHLIQNPKTTFFVQVEGDSMINVGIYSGDLLIVDRGLPVKNGKIVVASVSGEVTVKRFERSKGKTHLVSENEDYPPILVTDEMNLTIWGVVTNVVHSL